MKNLISYAPAFVAVGCVLRFNSSTTEVDIAEYPKDKRARKIIDAALADIVLFEDTANFSDGISSIHLSDFVDDQPNPLAKTIRLNVLNSLGIMQGEKYVLAALNSAKVNRSWHLSEKENECTYFGNICTHRGALNDPHRRGRKTNRQPFEYHQMTSRGISREQLVTPNVQALYDLIPAAVTTNSKDRIVTVFSEDSLKKLPKEKLEEIIRVAESIMGSK